MIKRIQIFVVLVCFIFNVGLPTVSSAQSSQAFLDLPVPGVLLSTSPSFTPALIKGLKIDAKNALGFNFIVDTGDTNLTGDALKQESNKMIKYFLAALTVPEKDLWVNLSPYEKDRIIAGGFGQTEMGRDMLAQDYVLKQLTASLIYPESQLGKSFWTKVYAKAREQYGTTNIPVNTFNKVWIIPDHAVIYEHDGTAFVIENNLKVMLEQDYLALSKSMVLMPDTHSYSSLRGAEGDAAISKRTTNSDVNALGSQIIREVLIPEIEKEVNTGKNFATLRQIANATVLAAWYKQALKESLLGKIYANKNKINGVDVQDKNVKMKIYNQYLQAFKKGVYNYIKEDFDPLTNRTVPKKYFSGGTVLDYGNRAMAIVKNEADLTRRGRTEIVQQMRSRHVFNVGGLYVETPVPDLASRAMLTSPVVSPEEQKFYTQISTDQIPSTFGANFVPHGLKLDQFWLSEVDPAAGKLSKPPLGHSPLGGNLATMISVSTAILQALAGSGASGTLEQILGKASVKAGNKFGDEIDARAVKVGRESLEAFAKIWDIVIFVGGNEGVFRDKSKDMPLGLGINPNGKNGVYMYFGDSVEVTNGVKREKGRPGTSTMVTLVPLMMPSTDGYRISMAVDKFNPKKPFPNIDPVITSTNTMRHMLKQLAEYMDAPDVEVFIRDMVAEYKFVTLKRPKHDQLEAQARELGFEIEDREDGDPLLFIRAMLGIKGKDGKKLFAISTGGSNEHIMSMILAALYKKALMTSTYAATETLKAVDKEYGAKGPKAGQGSLDKARDYSDGDLSNYDEVNKTFDDHRRAGFNIPQSPVTPQQLREHLLIPDSPELGMLRNGKTVSSMVISSITGANELDWGVLRQYIQPVTWTEFKDGSGKVVVSGFFINNDGKIYFFRAGLKSNDVLQSRYSLVAVNDLLPNPLITQYEKTRKSYTEMSERREIEQNIIDAHVRNIQELLKDEEGARQYLQSLDDAFTIQKRSVKTEEKFVLAVREAEKYILGDPTVTMENGTVHHIVQYVDAEQSASAAMTAGKAVPSRDRAALAQDRRHLGGINLNPAMYSIQIKRDGKGIPLPVDLQPIDKINISGLRVEIQSVTPANLPLMLGIAPTSQALAMSN